MNKRTHSEYLVIFLFQEFVDHNSRRFLKLPAVKTILLVLDFPAKKILLWVLPHIFLTLQRNPHFTGTLPRNPTFEKWSHIICFHCKINVYHCFECHSPAHIYYACTCMRFSLSLHCSLSSYAPILSAFLGLGKVSTQELILNLFVVQVTINQNWAQNLLALFAFTLKIIAWHPTLYKVADDKRMNTLIDR